MGNAFIFYLGVVATRILSYNGEDKMEVDRNLNPLVTLQDITETVAMMRSIISQPIISEIPDRFTLKLAVVGNRKFKDLSLVTDFLNKLSRVWKLIIISGEAEGVDTTAREWAEQYSYEYRRFPPKSHKRFDIELQEWVIYIPEQEYKKRNKQIADECQVLLAFINKGRYHAGTWNTINWLTQKSRYYYFFIYNEFGEMWHAEEYPKWLKKRLHINF